MPVVKTAASTPSSPVAVDGGINAQKYLDDILTLMMDMKLVELTHFIPQEWIKRCPEARLAPVK